MKVVFENVGMMLFKIVGLLASCKFIYCCFCWYSWCCFCS